MPILLRSRLEAMWQGGILRVADRSERAGRVAGTSAHTSSSNRTMKRSLALAAAVVLAGGCGGAETSPGPNAFPAARDGNFVLYVSNQSFEIPDVDIRVEIDGRVAVDEEFDVKDQHNWVEFRFLLPKGRHALKAVSKTGEAEGSWRFTVTSKQWAVVNYWYYPGERKRFSFDVSDEPIGLG